MTAEYRITTELVLSPADHWIATKKAQSYDEDLNLVETAQILTGELAFAHKAMEIIKRYEAFLETQRQARIDLAKRLLSVEVN